MTIVPRKRVDRVNACKYLKEKHGIIRSPKTLAKYATTGGGPRYQLAGRKPLYPVEELDQWVELILSPIVKNTSEARKAIMERGHAT